MGEFKSSSEKQNKKATPIQAPKEASSPGEMRHEDARGSTFQLAQLQAKADDRGRESNTAQLQTKALNFSRNSQLAQLQDKSTDRTPSSQSPTVQRQENKTGLPDGLKSGMESLSGMSLSDVKVHRNSDKPAQLQAHAYAQGTDIHLGPGQEKHLPHELGHVVQQKEGRVKPTVQLKGKVNINDNPGLEKEADFLGNKALSMKQSPPELANENSSKSGSSTGKEIQRKEVIQMQRTAAEEVAARLAFKTHFCEEFAGNTWLNYGGSFKSLEETADLVYDKLVATLATTKSAMAGLKHLDGGQAWETELATKGDRYKASSTGNTKVANGITPEFKAALKLAESFANELKDLTKQNKTAKKLTEKGFAFWSGNPAKKAAGASGLGSLEGSSLGGIFENTKLPEGVDMSIWGSISKAYAEWATEETSGKKYHGYVGLGGDRLDSIYNSIERWAVEGATSGKPTFRIQWFPVIPEESAYQEAEAAGEDRVKPDRYNKSPMSSGGSDVTDKGLTSRSQAEQMMLEADAERKDKVKNP